MILVIPANTYSADKILKKYYVIKWKADWCVPCQKWNKEEKKKLIDKGVSVVEIDIDKHPDLVKKYNVTTIPQFWIASKKPTAVYSNHKYIGGKNTASFLEERIKVLDKQLNGKDK